MTTPKKHLRRYQLHDGRLVESPVGELVRYEDVADVVRDQLHRLSRLVPLEDLLDLPGPPQAMHLQATRVHLHRLTPRQRTVLCHIGEGMSTRQIAQRMSLSPKTIETFKEQLKKRLGLETGNALHHFAIWLGMQGESADLTQDTETTIP